MIESALISVTSQGQITIPASIRRLLGISTGSSIAIDVKGDNIILKKPNDVFSRLGVHKDKSLKGKSFEEVLQIEENAFEYGVSKKFVKNNET